MLEIGPIPSQSVALNYIALLKSLPSSFYKHFSRIIWQKRFLKKYFWFLINLKVHYFFRSGDSIKNIFCTLAYWSQSCKFITLKWQGINNHFVLPFFWTWPPPFFISTDVAYPFAPWGERMHVYFNQTKPRTAARACLRQR